MASGGSPGGDAFRLSFGLVKEIVAAPEQTRLRVVKSSHALRWGGSCEHWMTDKGLLSFYVKQSPRQGLVGLRQGFGPASSVL